MRASAASRRKGLAVFDFEEGEDEVVEAQSARMMAKFRPRLRSDREKSIDKYTFLQAFSSGVGFTQGDIASCSLKEKTELDKAVIPTTGSTEHYALFTDDVNNDPYKISADVLSEHKESCKSLSGSMSISASNIEENKGCSKFAVSKGCNVKYGNKSQNDMNVTVDVDSIVYGNRQYGKSQLLFTAAWIKLICDDKKFMAEWPISDIKHINCQWKGCPAAALVELHFRKNSASEVEDYDPLMFSVRYVLWMDKLLKIKNLGSKYKAMLPKNLSDCSRREDEKDLIKVSPEDHFSDAPEHFEEVIYPKGDPDAVCLSKRDMERLQPEFFLNDTIVDFYIKYLNNKIHPNEKHRFHFFNSFFFRKIADLGKHHANLSKKRAAFMSVRKWTQKLNIFEKDYIFIPVNFDLHWSLIVICHSGEIAKLTDGGAKGSTKVPCILHMDSIKGSHRGLKTIIQSYIWEEWKERNPGILEENSSNFMNLRFVELDLPQQENAYDCGLFLLHYAELFLLEAPLNFSPSTISEVSNFLTANWFPPFEASLKRSFIRKLIYELQNDPSQKDVPIVCNKVHLPGSDNTERTTKEEQHWESNLDKSFVDKPSMYDTASNVFHCDEQTGVAQEYPEPVADILPLTEPVEHSDVGRTASANLAVEYDHILNGPIIAQPCAASMTLSIDGVNPMPVSTPEKECADQDPSHCLNDNLLVEADRELEKLEMAISDCFSYVSDSPTSSASEIYGYVEDSEETDGNRDPDDCQGYNTNCRNHNSIDCSSRHMSIMSNPAEAVSEVNVYQSVLETDAMKPNEKHCTVYAEAEILKLSFQETSRGNTKGLSQSNLQKSDPVSSVNIRIEDDVSSLSGGDDDDVQLIESRSVHQVLGEPRCEDDVCVLNTLDEVPNNDPIEISSGSFKRQKRSTVPSQDLFTTSENKSSDDNDVQLIETMPICQRSSQNISENSRRVTRSLAKYLR